MSLRRRDLIYKLASIFPSLGLLSFGLPLQASQSLINSGADRDINLVYKFKSKVGNLAEVIKCIDQVYGAPVDNYIKSQIGAGKLKSANKVIQNNQIIITFVFTDKNSMGTVVAGINKISNLNFLSKLRDSNIIQFEKIIS